MKTEEKLNLAAVMLATCLFCTMIYGEHVKRKVEKHYEEREKRMEQYRQSLLYDTILLYKKYPIIDTLTISH
jgi:hypothetical protein